MKSSQAPDPQTLPLEEQLVGINAKTAPYSAAGSWSGVRRRIVGKGALEFVETMFVEHRGEFGSKRKDGARKIAETSDGLYSLRRLRREAVS